MDESVTVPIRHILRLREALFLADHTLSARANYTDTRLAEVISCAVELTDEYIKK